MKKRRNKNFNNIYLLVIVLLILGVVGILIFKPKETKNNNTSVATPTPTDTVDKQEEKEVHKKEVTDYGTYIDGILIVNKVYHLSSDYNPGVDEEAYQALTELQAAASIDGFDMPLISGFRSYDLQSELYANYVARDGEELANTYSAKPGESEHQSGLAFDVGEIDNNYGETEAGKWLSKHAHEYGFIIRYMKGKEEITGYQYEPWHIRYLGKEIAQKVYDSGLTLEEYLGIN